MHVLVVNFQLEDMNHEQFSEACDGLAETFAQHRLPAGPN